MLVFLAKNFRICYIDLDFFFAQIFAYSRKKQ